MKAKLLTVLPLATLGASVPTAKRQSDSIWSRVLSLVQPYIGDSSLDLVSLVQAQNAIDAAGPIAPVTSEILEDYLGPVNVWNAYKQYEASANRLLGASPPQ